jgi:hypothetical protein
MPIQYIICTPMIETTCAFLPFRRHPSNHTRQVLWPNSPRSQRCQILNLCTSTWRAIGGVDEFFIQLVISTRLHPSRPSYRMLRDEFVINHLNFKNEKLGAHKILFLRALKPASYSRVACSPKMRKTFIVHINSQQQIVNSLILLSSLQNPLISSSLQTNKLE